MLTIVFQGIESKTHRDTLLSALELFDDPVPRVSAGISYRSLRSRRLGPTYIKSTAEASLPIVLEGGFNITPLSENDAIRTANAYYEFLGKNPEITSAIEFRHPSLTANAVPRPDDPRIIPVWDGRDPMDLESLLSETGSVAASYEVLGDKRLPVVMRRGGTPDGTRIVLTHSDLAEVKRAGFNSVLLGAWVHPGRFGDATIWDGTKLHRAKRTKRQEFYSSFGDAIQQAGLDLELISAGDARETNRLAAYSYISWAISLDDGSSTSDKTETSEALEAVIGHSSSTSVKKKGVKNTRRSVALPIFVQEDSEGLEEDLDGNMTIRTRSLLRASGETVRVCDSCFLASTCPAHEPESSCAFNFPIEVRTDAQVKSLLNSVMELQATRVAFARFAEEVNGGYPDEIVGREMDRLFRMAATMKRTEEKRERLTVSVESESSGGGTGVLSRIFGDRASLDSPPIAAIEADVIVAEVVEG